MLPDDTLTHMSSTAGTDTATIHNLLYPCFFLDVEEERRRRGDMSERAEEREGERSRGQEGKRARGREGERARGREGERARGDRSESMRSAVSFVSLTAAVSDMDETVHKLLGKFKGTQNEQ